MCWVVVLILPPPIPNSLALSRSLSLTASMFVSEMMQMECWRMSNKYTGKKMNTSFFTLFISSTQWANPFAFNATYFTCTTTISHRTDLSIKTNFSNLSKIYMFVVFLLFALLRIFLKFAVCQIRIFFNYCVCILYCIVVLTLLLTVWASVSATAQQQCVFVRMYTCIYIFCYTVRV